MSNEIKSIQMPKWGMEMSEGEINAWHVEIGAQINAEDDLVDVETSKIINTVTAAHSGVLRAIVAQPGETHDVGALLGVLASAETSEAEIQAFIDSQQNCQRRCSGSGACGSRTCSSPSGSTCTPGQ
jgi:pyruvate dehydrogenase E2 component (dihydrolipoamide acetyltransferase)